MSDFRLKVRSSHELTTVTTVLYCGQIQIKCTLGTWQVCFQYADMIWQSYHECIPVAVPWLNGINMKTRNYTQITFNCNKWSRSQTSQASENLKTSRSLRMWRYGNAGYSIPMFNNLLLTKTTHSVEQFASKSVWFILWKIKFDSVFAHKQAPFLWQWNSPSDETETTTSVSHV